MNIREGNRGIIREPIKFSLIAPLNCNDSLDSFLINRDENTELIYADVGRNELTRFEDSKGFESITRYSMNHPSISRGMNQLIQSSKNEWVILVDRPLEFRSDFFQKLREDITIFGDVLQGINFGIMGQTLYQSNNQKKWNNYIAMEDSRFETIRTAESEFSFICLHRNLIEVLNGIDERYDLNGNYRFNNFLLRLIRLGSYVVFDRFLMAYCNTENDLEIDLHTYNHIWENDKIEIANGKIKAFNRTELKLSNK